MRPWTGTRGFSRKEWTVYGMLEPGRSSYLHMRTAVSLDLTVPWLKTAGLVPLDNRLFCAASRAAFLLVFTLASVASGCGDAAVDSARLDPAETHSDETGSSGPEDAEAFSADAGIDDGDAAADDQGLPPQGSSDDRGAESTPLDPGGQDATSIEDPVEGPADVEVSDGDAAEDPGPEPTPAEALRIVPIGDSITQGRLGDGSFDSWNASTLSYRYALWKLLVDAGIEVDFVGSQRNGFGGDPAWEDYQGRPFDREHEGHWGWRLDQIRDSLELWLQGYEADIALIMLGTNDAGDGEDLGQMVEEAADIIAILRESNPNIVIVWGHAFQEWDPFPAFREAMEQLAFEQSTAASPIVTVDPSVGWVSDPTDPASDTVDWVHPNLQGDQKLADAFFEVLQDWF